jgi:hypothetical protein
LDISNAFARADVDEKLFVEMPHGYTKTDSSGHPMVCRLCKGLYGTKQAARLWHQTFRSRLLENGWRQFQSDSCIYMRRTPTFGIEYIGVYVDDVIHCTSHRLILNFTSIALLIFPPSHKANSRGF